MMLYYLHSTAVGVYYGIMPPGGRIGMSFRGTEIAVLKIIRKLILRLMLQIHHHEKNNNKNWIWKN